LGGAVTSKTPEECGLGFGRCVEFDGINGYIEIPDNSPINFLNKSTITVGAWIKVNSLLSGLTSLVHKWSGYVMETTGSSPWKFRWTLQTTVGYLTIMSTTTISPNVWYFIVGTYDGSTAKLYLNGTLEATGSHSGTISDSGNSLRLGCRSDAAPCAEPFGGLLDEVAIYSEALLSSQIQHLYGQGVIRRAIAYR